MAHACRDPLLVCRDPHQAVHACPVRPLAVRECPARLQAARLQACQARLRVVLRVCQARLRAVHRGWRVG